MVSSVPGQEAGVTGWLGSRLERLEALRKLGAGHWPEQEDSKKLLDRERGLVRTELLPPASSSAASSLDTSVSEPRPGLVAGLLTSRTPVTVVWLRKLPPSPMLAT